MAEKEKKKVPIGVRILGGLNCFLFGLSFLISSIFSYFKTGLDEFNEILKTFEASGATVPITYQQFKAYSLIPVIFAAIFLVSGAGLLLKKEWARKLTVYFAFLIVLFMLLAVLINPPLIRLVILQAAYLGALIIYFTNRDVESFYKEQ